MKAGLKTRLEPKDPIGSIGKYGLVCRASNRLYIRSLSPIFSLTLWKALERRSRLRNIFTREPEDGKSLGRSLSLSFDLSYLRSIDSLNLRLFFCADFQAKEWWPQQARPWTCQVHPLLQLRQMLPQGPLSLISCGCIYVCCYMYVCCSFSCVIA